MTICSVSDPITAAIHLGGKFEREDCGYFSSCTHTVEKYDTMANSYVEVTYCEINWMVAGPFLFLLLVILYQMKKRMAMPDLSSWRRDKHDPSSPPSYSRHHHRH